MSNKIAELIAKLIAKADQTSHPEEAETFMHKANALMEAHGVSLLDLEGAGANDPVGSSFDRSMYANSNAAWRTTLAGTVARYFGCEIVTQRIGTNTYWTVYGRESARTTFLLMWPFIDRQVLAAGRALHAQGDAKSAKDGHKLVGNALAMRVHKLTQARKQAAPVVASNGTALVPVDEIESLIALENPDLREGRARKVRVTTAARKAAEGVSISLQAGAARTKKIGAA